MKKTLTIITGILLLFYSQLQAQTPWAIRTDKILTPWAQQVDPNLPLPEYPRPQLVRNNNWKNLNGLWDYAIVPKGMQPTSYEGKILVPFAVESAISGVQRMVGKDSVLWYRRQVSVAEFKGKQVLLHFGAVDWQTEVFVNGKSVGSHEGGFDPFSINITSALKKDGFQDIKIKVWDPSDDGPQPRGKQVKKPRGIWYTPVTGIWQTVWLEALPTRYIASTKHTPDIDAHTITITGNFVNTLPSDQFKVEILEQGKVIATQVASSQQAVTLKMANEKLWSPSSPFLYDLRISLISNNKVIDQVMSYFAMRKISMGTDEKGIKRMLLNNKFLFQFGPLDQGWWPDGLYTPPTEAAMRFDVDELKKMGFNMIRKHIKVESARYYHYCDQVGMLLWQDMPSGDLGNNWNPNPGIINMESERPRNAESESYYKKEWNAIMESLHNFPSIVVWVPFNEAWGQFKTTEITEWTMKKDPSRLINSASGGNYFNTGHFTDVHSYPQPAMPRPDLFGKNTILVLGEYGGLGLPLEGHTWQQKNNWGYQSFKTPEELFAKYDVFTTRLTELIGLGLSAAVYTQTTDVEIETNGLMTYDRKVVKIPVPQLYQSNNKVYRPVVTVR
ncbi:MAG: glycoside hydrolase family 2 TIM barrel-domain containing protein [Pedobacter sp.]|nr:glycoside hydrolase family 2 TIM barrel-domain containing protein [Pedobacter sp.]MDQ8051380.1 glycoside hydrolase family 2 TIM barrel-domain containing protein [Pedobacter sp.]